MADLSLFLIYAGLTGFSASVIRSLLQKLLAQHGYKGLDNFALTVLVLFIVMPNFFLTAGGVLSCAYAFILTMTSKEGEGSRLLLEKVLSFLWVYYPFYPSILQNFNHGPSF